MRWLLVYISLILFSVKVYAQNNYFSGGDRTSIFLCQDGHVYGSGGNDNGQLGRGRALPGTISSPDIVSGIGGLGTLTHIKQVCGKQYLSMIALSTTGDSVITWGSNSNGQLGNNLYGDAPVANNNYFPYRVVGVNNVGSLTGIKYVTMGVLTAYAVSNGGKALAWGSDNQGALGNGTNGPDMTSPVYVLTSPVDTLKNVTLVVGGNDFAIALLSDGTVWGWGYNNIGQLGQNTTLSSNYAVQVKGRNGVGFLNNIVSISCSETHVLALSAKDTLWAWGDNTKGQLGNNSNTNSLTPVFVLNGLATGPMRNVTAIACGTSYSMALKGDSTISAWGDNVFGQLGNNTNTGSLIPQKVLSETGAGSLKNIVQISAGRQFSMARKATGEILNWGSNNNGQLGLTDYMDRKLPVVMTAQPCTWAAPPTFVKGTISGPASVCTPTNTGSVVLSGQTGSVIAWHSSTNNFANYSVTNSSSTTFNFTNLSQKTSFRAVIQFNDYIGYSDSLVVQVSLASVGGALGSPATVCSGTNSGTLTLTGYTGAITGWESSADSFATAGVPIVNTINTYNYTNLSSTLFYRAIVKNGSCTAANSLIVKITVNAPSAGGTIAPANTVCFGTNSGAMTLSGQTGNILQWEYSSDNFSSFINVISNTTITQNYSNLTVATYYRALVKNGVCPSAYSATNIISVDPSSSGGSIASPAVVCSGANSGLLTLSSYTGTVLDWETSTDNFATILTTPPNTTVTQNYSNLTATTYYRAKVQSGVCPMAYSSTTIITVTPVSVGGAVNTSTTVCVNSNSGTLTLSGNQGSVVQWESSTDNFTTITIIANTGNTQNYNNLTLTTSYRAQVKNGPCAAIYSTPATISVDQLSVAGTLGAPATVCSGSNTGTLNLTGPIVGNVTLWQWSTDNFSTISNPIANTTTSQGYSNLTTTTEYRARVKNGVCPSVASNVITILVNSISAGGTVNTSTSECSGTNGATLTLSGQFGAILNWESSTDNFTTITPIANVSTTQTYSNLTTTTQYRANVQSGVCPSAYSTTATITVYPVSAGGSINSPDIVCYGFNSGTLTLVNNTGGVVRWESSTDNFATATPIANTTLLQNYSNLTLTNQYRALVQNGVCASVYSSVVEITVNPNSAGGSIDGADTVCIAANGGILNLSGYLGTVIQWETSTDNFATVIVPVSNTTNSYMYSNLTTSTYFRAQIQNTGCAIAYSAPVLIKVDPLSNGGTLNSPSVVCANANSGILNLVGEIGAIIRWEISSDNFVSNISPVANTTNAENYLNLASTTYYRTVVQSGVCSAATSNIVAVTVNPASVPGTIIGAKNVCVKGNGSSLVLVGYSGSILQWELSHDNFATSAIIPNYTNTYNYSNITTATSLRVLVQYSPCPAVYTPAFDFTINPATAGGIIDGNSVVEKNTSTGPLTLVDFTGAVIQWEYSSDTAAVWKILPVTSNVYVFTNVDSFLFVRVKVQSGNCVSRYSSVFSIIIGEIVNKNIKIYPTISPNNDNINDEWIIDNITTAPANSVRIFNRWGDLVYEEKGYDNTSKVWKGQSNVRMTVAGHDLPEGTYFYLVDPGNGKPEFSGYVVLNR